MDLNHIPGRMRSFAGCLSDLDAAIDRMIATQADAYPRHWTNAERREMAERHLFGEKA